MITALVLFLPSALCAEPQPPPQLQIKILEPQEALNNIKQQTAREAIVEITDENHKPVAGALVIFTLPQSGGPGAAFADGSLAFQQQTDAAGRVATPRFSPNQLVGSYQIQVEVAYNGVRAVATIKQSNYIGPSSPADHPVVHSVGHAAFPLKAVLIVAAATAVATVVAIIAARPGNAGAIITPGSGTVTAPAVRKSSGARR